MYQFIYQFNLIEKVLIFTVRLCSLADINDDRHIDFLSFFFLYLLRVEREHLLYYSIWWKKLTIPLYLAILREEWQQNALSRHRKRHVARFAAASWKFNVDKVSRNLLFSEHFSFSHSHRRRSSGNPRYWSMEGSDANETNKRGERNPDGIFFSLESCLIWKQGG